MPANSSQSTGLIEFDDRKSQVFSRSLDERSHLVLSQQERLEGYALYLPTFTAQFPLLLGRVMQTAV